MTTYQQALAERAPELNALHMETLAYERSETLNGQPASFFDSIADEARLMGAERLAVLHEWAVV